MLNKNHLQYQIFNHCANPLWSYENCLKLVIMKNKPHPLKANSVQKIEKPLGHNIIKGQKIIKENINLKAVDIG